MTKADPDPQAEQGGRHRSSRDRDDEVAPPESPPDEPAQDEGSTEDAAPEKDTAPEDDPPQDDEPEAAAPAREEPKDEAPKAAAPRDTAPKNASAPAKGATRYEPDEDEAPKRTFLPIGHHAAGVPLLIAAGLVTGLSLAPLLFDRLNFDVALDAAANARSAAAPWPADAAPWFTPGWVAGTAFVVSAVVLVLALVALRLPDIVVFVLGAVLTATTAWAAFATLDVVNAGLWELIPVCFLCLLAFGLAATATGRWRSAPGTKGGESAGGVAAAALAAWLVVGLVLLAGAAIAASARTHAFGDAEASPHGVPGLLSVRASDGPQLDGYRGLWMAQLTAAQVADDEQASAYAVRHHDSSARFPTLLVRGDDTGAPDLDDTWWVTLVRQSFRSRAEVEAWCAGAGLAPETCTPRMISD